ncbi:unnamed protein product [Natator depressus]
MIRPPTSQASSPFLPFVTFSYSLEPLMSACGSLSPRQSPPGSPTNPAKPETQLQTQTGERAGGAEKPWPRRPDPPAPAPSGAGWIKQTRPPGSDGRGSAQGIPGPSSRWDSGIASFTLRGVGEG